MTADLLPCPFCGGKNMRYEPTEQSIFCIRCGATGPYKHFPYSPDEIWNTRHEPDELPEWVLKLLRDTMYLFKPTDTQEFREGYVAAVEWFLSLRKPE